MPLDLPDGTDCFVDSTIFYYSLVSTPGLSNPCVALIDRIAQGKISASCTFQVLADVVHKVMMYEAVVLTGRPRAGIVGWLKRHPESLDKLTEYKIAATRLRSLPLRMLPVDQQLLEEAADVSASQRLLTNDAIIAALMQRHQITDLATNDDDFDSLAGVKVWKPR